MSAAALYSGFCWICGEETESVIKGVALHMSCLACPRCTSTMVMWDRRSDPLLFRCLCCLQGWTLPAPKRLGLPARPDRQLEHFAHFIRLTDRSVDGGDED